MIRNRRIGLSQSGIQQALKKFGPARYFKEFCDKAYDYVNNLDLKYSRWLGIPNSIRMTSVKPSGTISLLTGSTPGIHCAHSEYYMRTVRTSANDPLINDLLKANYRIEIANTSKKQYQNACKGLLEYPSWRDDLLVSELPNEVLEAFKKQAGTVVIYFPIHEKNFTKSKRDISMWEQLTLVKELQYYWADNSVSATVTVKEEEKKDLAWAIEFFSAKVKALSFLPLDNHSYIQAPYQECSKEAFESYSASLQLIDIQKVNSDQDSERFCSNDKCLV
jgi:hypothetical protein